MPTWETASAMTARAGVCMLTLSHAVDFPLLAARLLLTKRYLRGPTPLTVIVFDDEPAHQHFCNTYGARVCGPDIVPLHLSQLLGKANYSYVRRTLFASRMQSHRTMHYKFNNFRNTKCKPMGAGRVYQALKKFYAVAHGPCETYWVADSESFPFRPFRFVDLVQPGAGRWLSANWFADKRCSFLYNSHTHAECTMLTSSLLGLQRAYHARGNLTSRQWGQYGSQTSHVDQMWFYDRQMVASMINYVEGKLRLPFPQVFAGLGVADQFFYGLWVHHQNAVPGPTQRVLDLMEELRVAMPEAYHKCCDCRRRKQEGDTERDTSAEPCHLLRHLGSPCMRRYAGDQRIADFIVGRLGVFGNWMETNPLPGGIMSANPGFSWCINNCFHRAALTRVANISGVDAEEVRNTDAVVRSAFDRDPPTNTWRLRPAAPIDTPSTRQPQWR